MTGRRMQSSEMFIALPLAGSVARYALLRRPLDRLGALGDPLGAVDDHLLPGRQLALHHGAVAGDADQLDVAPVRRAIRPEHEDEAALLAGLQRRAGDRDRVLLLAR